MWSLERRGLRQWRLGRDLCRHGLRLAPRGLKSAGGGELGPLVPPGGGQDDAWAKNTWENRGIVLETDGT